MSRMSSIVDWIGRRDHGRPARVRLPFIDTTAGADVRADPSAAVGLWQKAEPLLPAALPPAWSNLDETACLWLYATALAHELKPYGPGPAGIDLASLLAAPALDCSTYGHLAHHLVQLCAKTDARREAAFVGWHGGAIGNHQILLVETPSSGSLLLDPTVGVAARTGFDDLAAGVPVASADIIEVSARTEIAASRAALVSALLTGAFRPSHLLYYFESRDQFVAEFGRIGAWPTPGAALWRAERSRGAPA